MPYHHHYLDHHHDQDVMRWILIWRHTRLSLLAPDLPQMHNLDIIINIIIVIIVIIIIIMLV